GEEQDDSRRRKPVSPEARKVIQERIAVSSQLAGPSARQPMSVPQDGFGRIVQRERPTPGAASATGSQNGRSAASASSRPGSRGSVDTGSSSRGSAAPATPAAGRGSVEAPSGGRGSVAAPAPRP